MPQKKLVYYFYILRCADNTLYCGQTTDLARRVTEHNSKTKKSAKYTRARQPVELVYSEECIDLGTALRREVEVKKWPRSRKLKLVMMK